MTTPSCANNASPCPANAVCNVFVLKAVALTAITPGMTRLASIFKFSNLSGTVFAKVLFTSPYAAITTLDPEFNPSPE